MDNPLLQMAGLSDQSNSSTPSSDSNPLLQMAGLSSDNSATTNVTPTTNPPSTVSGDYISKRAQDFGLDPRAVMGVASNEGLSGGVGDGGHAFGPFQLNDAGGVITNRFPNWSPAQIQQWAWSHEGIDYALKTMADNGARGLTGPDAVRAIVSKFERPKDPTGDLQAGYNSVGGQ